jgi:hypothetical protein
MQFSFGGCLQPFGFAPFDRLRTPQGVGVRRK